MKTLSNIRMWAECILLLSFGAALTACNDDDLPALTPALPANGGAPVVSIVHLGSVPPSYDWLFDYSHGRLSQAEGIVRDPSPTIDRSFSYVSKLSYKYQAVRVKNSSKEETQVEINGQGFIQTMTVNRNIYNFFYNPMGFLIGWDKTVFEDSFGQAQQYKSSAVIEYDNGNFSKITYTETDNAPIVLRFTPSHQANLNGLLPVTISKEFGCLGFEHLYYAGLFGRSTKDLVQTIRYEFPDAHDNYRLDFEYSNKNGNTVLCNYHAQDGSIASVSYTY